jgi:hypothetical protein
MTTATEFDIDTATGLPVVPEGFFWRVGNAADYDDYGGKKTYPGVALMQKQEPKLETFETPIHGVNWLGISKIVGYDKEERLVDQEPKQVYFEKFSPRFAFKEENIPSFAVNQRPYKAYNEDSWFYDLPLSEEGISYLATYIWNDHIKQMRKKEEYDRRMAERRTLEEKFFGDYPPKTLVG